LASPSRPALTMYRWMMIKKVWVGHQVIICWIKKPTLDFKKKLNWICCSHVVLWTRKEISRVTKPILGSYLSNGKNSLIFFSN
jgi:hypothetical protein